MNILSALYEIYDQLYPKLYYVVTDMTPAGQALKTPAGDFFPEVWYFHPDDWEPIRAELTLQYRLVDFRSWRPTREDVLRSASKRVGSGH